MAGYLGNIPSAVPLTSADIADSIITSAKIADGTIALADLSATGTKDATTFLRGDNSFASAGATAGQVIQVVTATTSTAFTTTSSSFTAVTNLSVSITPSSASNKILILVSSTIHVNSANQAGRVTIFRGATDLGNSTKGLSAIYASSGTIVAPLHISFLDSPSTTSATTYQVYIKTTGGTVFVPWDDEKSSITVLEIKG